MDSRFPDFLLPPPPPKHFKLTYFQFEDRGLGNWSWKLGSSTQILWKKLNRQKGYTFPVHCTGLQTTPHFRAWREYMRSIPNAYLVLKQKETQSCLGSVSWSMTQKNIKCNRSFVIIYKKDIWQFSVWRKKRVIGDSKALLPNKSRVTRYGC